MFFHSIWTWYSREVREAIYAVVEIPILLDLALEYVMTMSFQYLVEDRDPLEDLRR
jgi:hypothetical protein